MATPTGPAGLLRIYTHEAAREGHHPLYGAAAHLRNANIIDLAADLPLVIEIIDTEADLRAFLPTLTAMQAIGLITLEKVEVLHAPAHAK
jgi:PII-like signaling protein